MRPTNIADKFIRALLYCALPLLTLASCQRPGKSGAPRVMLTAHMDEPGFLVKDVDGDGKVWMKFFGGVPTERISGRLGVINGTERCIFSAKPIHQLSGDERSKPTAADRIYAELPPYIT